MSSVDRERDKWREGEREKKIIRMNYLCMDTSLFVIGIDKATVIIFAYCVLGKQKYQRVREC